VSRNVEGLITGRRGSGKSSTAKRIATHEERLFVFDPNDEYGDLVSTRVSGEGEFLEFLEEVPRDRSRYAVRWVPEFDPSGDAEIFFQHVYGATKHYGEGATLLIDEAHLLFASAGFTPPHLGRCLRLGRHAGLNVVLVTPRIAEISRSASFQADWILCAGAVSEPADLAGLELRASPEFRRTVESLGQFGQALWDAVERKQRKISPRVLSRLLVPGALKEGAEISSCAV